MSSSALRREERRAALLRLQKLLWSAEASFSSGVAASGEIALARLAEGFELFRSQFQEEIDGTTDVDEGEQRRFALITLARVLLDMDRAVAIGDQEGVAVALEKAKAALVLSRQFDEERHASGVRSRPVSG
jgi:hypothetical protein